MLGEVTNLRWRARLIVSLVVLAAIVGLLPTSARAADISTSPVSLATAATGVVQVPGAAAWVAQAQGVLGQIHQATMVSQLSVSSVNAAQKHLALARLTSLLSAPLAPISLSSQVASTGLLGQLNQLLASPVFPELAKQESILLGTPQFLSDIPQALTSLGQGEPFTVTGWTLPGASVTTMQPASLLGDIGKFVSDAVATISGTAGIYAGTLLIAAFFCGVSIVCAAGLIVAGAFTGAAFDLYMGGILIGDGEMIVGDVVQTAQGVVQGIIPCQTQVGCFLYP